MEYKGDCYVLSSGRKVYANGGIIGLTPLDIMEISEGYDGTVYLPGYNKHEDPWSDEDQMEVSVYMRDLWQRRIAILEGKDGD